MRKKTRIIVIVTVLLVVFAGVIFWVGRSNRANAPVKTEEQLNAGQIKETEAIEENQGGVESGGSYEPAGDGMYWFIVKEMGIKFKVNKELKDDGLVYYHERGVPTPAYGKFAESVKFSTKELEEVDENCSTREFPLGIFIKLEGKLSDYNDDGYFAARNPKQMKNSIIYYNTPGVLCSDNPSLMRVYKKYNTFLLNTSDTMQSI